MLSANPNFKGTVHVHLIPKIGGVEPTCRRAANEAHEKSDGANPYNSDLRGCVLVPKKKDLVTVQITLRSSLLTAGTRGCNLSTERSSLH